MPRSSAPFDGTLSYPLDSTEYGGGVGDPSLLLEHCFSPMQAASALYTDSSDRIPEAIVAGLSRQVFESDLPRPSGSLRRLLARLVLRILKRTTHSELHPGSDGREITVYRNRILERSKHPYASAILRPSDADSANFVEGGDPMIAPYMMILPEVRRNAVTWDRLLLDSVIGQDVQLRFVWETKITHEIASRRLKSGEPVRLKAAAAGTGLSLILVYDRLIREGHDPGQITATITDRAPANVNKANRLISSLVTTRDNIANKAKEVGISARVEDLFDAESSQEDQSHIVTLIGILEYFHGFTITTTEEHLGHPLSLDDEDDAEAVLRGIAAITAESGTLIANSYRTETGARLLEVFGKRFRYRNREDLHALVKTAGFVPAGAVGSGHIYDVEAFEKRTASA